MATRKQKLTRNVNDYTAGQPYCCKDSKDCSIVKTFLEN